MLQRKPLHSGLTTQDSETIPPIVHEVLRSPGQSLDVATRNFFEPRFGHDFSQVRVNSGMPMAYSNLTMNDPGDEYERDTEKVLKQALEDTTSRAEKKIQPPVEYDFSQVRIHTDVKAAESAQAINARAYTVGRDIVFGAGQYSPHSTQGRRLLAHELAHVVQQKNQVASGAYTLLAAGNSAERDAEDAERSVENARVPQIAHQISSTQIGRAEKPGGAAALPSPSNAPGASSSTGTSTAPSSGHPGGSKPQPLRFDILGADIPLANFLAKAAGLSRGADLRVTSLEDMINQLEARVPANSGRCVEHISIFNHGRPGYQLVAGPAGGVEKKGSKGSTLPKSYLSLEWLYQSANQTALVRLRNIFCCGARMDWLGCGVAGIEAQGGKRTEKELEESEERYKEYGSRYQSEQDALAHGANLQGATFGQVTVQTWVDATCTTIRAATDHVFYDPDKTPSYWVGYRGEFLDLKPSAAGQCSCDPASGRVQGKWDPGKAIDFGDAKWRADLAKFNQAVKPLSGSPNANQITQSILALLGDVASGLSIPAGLPANPKVEPWINPVSADPNWIAKTYDHLVFCYPDDCWKWIGVNRMIVQQTPAYTKTTLDHELQHALDMFVAAFEYKLINGNPPSAPGDACKPGYNPVDSDPYGKYILDFRKYYEGGLSASRHVDIYATSAAPNFQRFTPEEKLVWFGGMITSVSADIPPAEPLPAERLVASVFQNPLPYEASMRNKFATELFKVTRVFIYGESQGKGKDLGKAKTLVNHFKEVWAIHPSDRALFAQAIRSEESGKPGSTP
jgi:hypothetical protein